MKCVGNSADYPGGSCPIPCGLRVNVPTPTVVNQLEGMGCPPPGLGCQPYPCNACYRWDQTFFISETMAGFSSAYGWAFNAAESDLTDCDNTHFVFDGVVEYKCWTRLNAECADTPTSEEWPIACEAEKQLTMRLEIDITWDGECGEIEARLINAVDLLECIRPIDLGTGLPAPYPRTTHTYTFTRNWCSCADLLGALTYVGVVSVNNERGITVSDPCNLASAEVSLPDRLSAECSRCWCYECEMISQIAISGANFTGTIELSNSSIHPGFIGCTVTGYLPTIEGCTLAPTLIQVAITCHECEEYTATVTIGGEYYTTPGFTCAGSKTFSFPSDFAIECLRDHVFTLS